MPKPRSDVEIKSSFYLLLLSSIWWDVCWVNEFVGSWVWIRKQPNQKDPHPATYKFIDPTDIPPNSA